MRILMIGDVIGKPGRRALQKLVPLVRQECGIDMVIANAENNHQLDVDRLYVSEATVGRSFVMRRWRARARGRTARIRKPFSRLTIVVREKEESV